MIFIILGWLYWFIVCLLISFGSLKLISKFTGVGISFNRNVFYHFWFGFVTLIALLQVVSLFFPLGTGVFVAVSVLAIVSGIFHYRLIIVEVQKLFAKGATARGFLAFTGVLILLVFIAFCTNKEVTHTDTFIYHYNAVKWVKEYPAVPGLVNLHGRLGFNSSFFLFSALTEFGIYNNHSAHIALSLLMTVGLLHWSFVILNRRALMRTRIFCMLTLVYILIHICMKMDIASLATDYPMAIITLVFSLVLIDNTDHKYLLLLPLAAVAFTFKLGGMPMIGVAVLALLARMYYVRYGYQLPQIVRQEKNLSRISFVLMCLIISGFIIRNVIVSGWLLYPFPIGNLHLPWSSPKPYVLDMIDWIKSYPKIPGGASPQTINGNGFFFWFTQWFHRFIQSIEFFLLFGGMLILFYACLQVSSFLRFIYGRMNVLLLIIFSILSITFWFISAPDVRFGSVYFFIFFASTVVLLYEGSSQQNILKLLIYAGVVYQVIVYTPAYTVDREPLWFTLAYTSQPKLLKVIASPQGEVPPLYLYMPAEGNQCGNAPLPCSPYAGGLLHVHQPIRQRVPGDLSKGFLPPK